MLKLTTDILQPGMVLAKTINDTRGRTLLREGISLTDDYIAVLKQRDFPEAHIITEPLADIVVDSLIPAAIHQQAQSALHGVFEFVKATTVEFVAANNGSSKGLTEDSAVADQLQRSPDFNAIEQAIKALLNNLCEPNVLANLTQIRQHSANQFSHAIDVATIALGLGYQLHLSADDMVRLGTGCLLHDIGKVFFTPEIFSAAETKYKAPVSPLRLRDHTRLGYELLRSRNPDAVMVNHVALSHHERQDGTGYPKGIRGTNSVQRTKFTRDALLLGVEIATVADVYVGLSRHTPPRPALTPAQVSDTMRRMSGTFLNRELVDIFLKMLPILPAGISIIVKSGQYSNYKGVVLKANPEEPDLPDIRLLFNSHGGRITPVDLNLAKKKNLTVEATLS
jgi:putative nucleotidyltransferase with HDIG domain